MDIRYIDYQKKNRFMGHILNFTEYLNTNVVAKGIEESKMFKTFESCVYLQKSKKSRKSYFSKVGRIFENHTVAKNQLIQDELGFIKENYKSWISGSSKINVISINDNEKFLFSKDGTHYIISNETYNRLNEDKNMFQQFGDFIASFIYGAKDALSWLAVALEFFAMFSKFTPMPALGSFALFGAGGIHIFEFFKLVTGSTPNINLEGKYGKAPKTPPVPKVSKILDSEDWKSLKISKQTETVLTAFQETLKNIKAKNDRFNSQTYIDLLQKSLKKAKEQASSKKFDNNRIQSLYVSIIAKYKEQFEENLQQFSSKGSNQKSQTETAYNIFISNLNTKVKDVKKHFGLIGESLVFEGLKPDKDEVSTVKEWFDESIGTLSFAMGALISGGLSIAEGVKHLSPLSIYVPKGGLIKQGAEKSLEPCKSALGKILEKRGLKFLEKVDASKTAKVINNVTGSGIVTAVKKSKTVGKLASAEGHGKIATIAKNSGENVMVYVNKMFIKGGGKYLSNNPIVIGEILFETIAKFFMKLAIYGIGSFIGIQILDTLANIKKIWEHILNFIKNPIDVISGWISSIKKEIGKLFESVKYDSKYSLNEKNEMKDKSVFEYLLNILSMVIDYGSTMINKTYTFIMKYIKKINFDFFDELIPTDEENLVLNEYFPKGSKVSGDESVMGEYKEKAKKSNYLQNIEPKKGVKNAKDGKELVSLLKDSLSFDSYMKSKDSMVMERTWFDLFKGDKNKKFANQPTQELKDKALIEKWLHDNDIHKFTINGNLTVDVYQDVPLGNSNLYIIPVKFGKVMGQFSVGYNHLKSLKNCPQYVQGVFGCSGNQLESLAYSPEYVGGYYDCSVNRLRNLDGITKNIKGTAGVFVNRNLVQFDINDVMVHTNLNQEFINKCLNSPTIHYMHFGCDIKKR